MDGREVLFAEKCHSYLLLITNNSSQLHRTQVCGRRRNVLEIARGDALRGGRHASSPVRCRSQPLPCQHLEYLLGGRGGWLLAVAVDSEVVDGFVLLVIWNSG